MAPGVADNPNSPMGCPGQRPPRGQMRRVLLAEWRAGRSMVAMERAYRMAHRTVRRLLEEAGADLPERRSMFDLHGRERAAFAAKLVAEYDSSAGPTVHALARRHQVSPQTARKLMNEARQAEATRRAHQRLDKFDPMWQPNRPGWDAISGHPSPDRLRQGSVEPAVAARTAAAS